MDNGDKLIQKAVQVIRGGGLVALPTDTVYCLAADPFNTEAVARVYKVKQRPRDMALPVMVADMEQLKSICQVSPLALFLAQEFFPFGFTLVLPKLPLLPDIVTAGKSTVAVRIQGHPRATEIIKKLGHGIVATSANIHHLRSPTTAQGVRDQLKDSVDMIVDGICQGGVESTIVDVSQNRVEVLREGAVPASRVEQALKRFPKAKSKQVKCR